MTTEDAAVTGADFSDPSYYFNRELSWLEFNRRVLAQAADASLPLLERLRFLSIFGSNLDEFFMVRVAGLKQQYAMGVAELSADGLSPSEQLEMIAAAARPLLHDAAACLHNDIVPLLTQAGLSIHDLHDLSAEQRDRLSDWFDASVLPVLTPLAVDPGHPFPYISSLSLSLAVVVRNPKTGSEHFARVKVPDGILPRFVPMATITDSAHGYVPLEQLIAAHLPRLFPGMDVVESYPFRVTRNADLEIEEDEADDLLLAIEAQLRRRRFGAVVRLEVSDAMPAAMLQRLCEELGVSDVDTYRLPGLLRFTDFDEIVAVEEADLHWPEWRRVPHHRFPDVSASAAAVFAAIRDGDILVQHPFEDFGLTVERFLHAAAHDPDVLAIKQTVYRTAGDSPIVRSLIQAAAHGKQVVALVELKARFDEQANIKWARELERAGVHVVYGLVGLKTHAKCALVVRRESDGIRRYAHVATGNYNARTARLYTDLGLFTCDEQIGQDVSDLFHFLTGYSRHDAYERLLVAPLALRRRLVELIRGQVQRQALSGDGRIRAKLNALVDQAIIAELYRASQAGVQIDLVVRGVCTLRPSVAGVSENIRVVSIVGRLLEHARVLQFGDDFWIGSADWMPRNLDRRVEALVPITDPALKETLSEHLDVELAANARAWVLQSDGSWTLRAPLSDERLLDTQALMLDMALDRNHVD